MALSLVKGDQVWMPGGNQEMIYERATVVIVKEDLVSLRRNSDKKLINIPTAQKQLIPKIAHVENPEKCTDLVALNPPHNANILSLLQARSTKHERPYTFVGPVLISVNPVTRASSKVQKKLETGPHPFRIAETAVRQLKFARYQAAADQTTEDIHINQAIVISGESGSGKTEAAKRVLKKLVELLPEQTSGETKKSKRDAASPLDKRLIETNPILEAFGNAQTIRNGNSSRFGKYMKLHLTNNKKLQLSGGSIVTYLLERSRVVHVAPGERNYHVFYQLLCSGVYDDDFALKGCTFSYLTPSSRSSQQSAETSYDKSQAKSNFTTLTRALSEIGVSESLQKHVFSILAGILHLGNIPLVGADGSGDDPHAASDVNASIKACKPKNLKFVCEAFGVSKAELFDALCTRPIKVARETLTADNSVMDAAKARDALAKHTYSRLFDWIVTQCNLNLMNGKPPSTEDNSIGVLDIFGFETFARNDLEQLLINYTNEALHNIFLQKVFDAELSMYREEGLLTDEHASITVPQNDECLLLLGGTGALLSKPGKPSPGLLDVIADEGKNPNATDGKMLQQLYVKFGQNMDLFPLPHPKDRDHMFKVKHYSGQVAYHIGNFLSKNHDQLPQHIQHVVEEKSINTLLNELYGGVVSDAIASSLKQSAGDKENRNNRKSLARMKSSVSMFRMKQDDGASAGGRPSNQKPTSIITAFKKQIRDLCVTLSASQCSFVRCIKPNFFLDRSAGSDDWFNPAYVHAQLKCLGIEPTVQVLSLGLPSRVAYSEFSERYEHSLEKKSIDMWLKMGADQRTFTASLLWAFGIEPSMYKLGLQRVFFRSGDLEKLEGILNATDMSKKELRGVSKRFRSFLVRSRWRKCMATVTCFNAFVGVLAKVRDDKAKQEERLQTGVVAVQKLFRGMKARERVMKLRAKRLRDKLKEAQEASEEAEMEMRRREALVENAETARKEAEEAAEGDGRRLMEEAMELMRLSQEQDEAIEQEKEELGNIRNEREEAENRALELQIQLEEELEDSFRRKEEARKEQEEVDEDEGRYLMEQAMRMMDEGSTDIAVEEYDVAKRLKKTLKKQVKLAKAKKKEEKVIKKRLKDNIRKKTLLQRKNRRVQETISKDQRIQKALQNHQAMLSVESKAKKLQQRAERAKLEKEQAQTELQREEERLKAFQMKRMQSTQRMLDTKHEERSKPLQHVRTMLRTNTARHLQDKPEHTFWAVKRARKRGRNWKQRFFVLSKVENTLTYYVKKNKKGKPVGKKGVFVLDRHVNITAFEKPMEKKGNVLKLESSKSGSLFISFMDEFSRRHVQQEILGAIQTIKQLTAVAEIDQLGRNGSSGSIQSPDTLESFYAKEAEQLYKLQEEGVISESELQELLSPSTASLANANELFKIQERDYNDWDNNIETTCEVCGELNNTMFAPYCRVCKTVLPVNPVDLL